MRKMGLEHRNPCEKPYKIRIFGSKHIKSEQKSEQREKGES